MWNRMITQLRVRFLVFTNAGMLTEAEAYAVAIERLTVREAMQASHRVEGEC